MRLDDLDRAAYLRDALKEVDERIEQATSHLGVTLHGRYQDAQLLERVRPVVLAFLQEERDGVLAKLKEIGVGA